MPWALRRRMTEVYVFYEAATEILLGPFRPRERFKPMPRRKALEKLSRDWKRLPALTRRRSVCTYKNGKLRIIDSRCIPCKLQLDRTDDRRWQPPVVYLSVS